MATDSLWEIGDLVRISGNPHDVIGVVTYVELSEPEPYRVEFFYGQGWYHGLKLYLADIDAISSAAPQEE